MHKSQLLELSLAGGAVFWLTSLVIAFLPFSAQFRAAESYTFSDVLWGAFPAGFLIALFVTYTVDCHTERLPTKSPTSKAVTLSLVALLVIEIAATLLHGGDELYYFSIGALLSLPRFLALGITLGYLVPRIDAK